MTLRRGTGCRRWRSPARRGTSAAILYLPDTAALPQPSHGDGRQGIDDVGPRPGVRTRRCEISPACIRLR
eukprot:2565736-Lingulodinium_polyedra.AAC.1